MHSYKKIEEAANSYIIKIIVNMKPQIMNSMMATNEPPDCSPKLYDTKRCQYIPIDCKEQIPNLTRIIELIEAYYVTSSIITPDNTLVKYATNTSIVQDLSSKSFIQLASNHETSPQISRSSYHFSNVNCANHPTTPDDTNPTYNSFSDPTSVIEEFDTAMKLNHNEEAKFDHFDLFPNVHNDRSAHVHGTCNLQEKHESKLLPSLTFTAPAISVHKSTRGPSKHLEYFDSEDKSQEQFQAIKRDLPSIDQEPSFRRAVRIPVESSSTGNVTENKVVTLPQAHCDERALSQAPAAISGRSMAPDLVSTSAPAPRQMVSGSYKISSRERYPVECTEVSVPPVEYSASPIDLVPVKDTHVQCVLRISQIQENTGKSTCTAPRNLCIPREASRRIRFSPRRFAEICKSV
jgi:hypothetical protein